MIKTGLESKVVLVDFALSSEVRGDMGDFPPSMARQEFAEECDINTIMARYEKTGAISHVNRVIPVYMDLTQVPDLRGAMDAMREASIAFNLFPAKVRREFDNDPQKFVDFAQDPENIGKMREWGLAPPVPVEEPPLRVSVIAPVVVPPPVVPVA